MTEGILIVGDGCIGTFLAAALQNLDYRVRIEGRNGRVESPITLYADEKSTVIVPDIKPMEISLIFVAVKAYDLFSAIQRLPRDMKRHVPCIVLCNGFIEPILTRCEAARRGVLRRGICTVGITREAQNSFRLKSKAGNVVWGPTCSQPVTAVEAQLFTKKLVTPFAWSENVVGEVQEKWVINMVINTIAAANAYQSNYLVLSDKSQFTAVLEESLRLGRRIWPDWYPDDEAIKHRLSKIIQSTGENCNSMVQDVLSGRKTELDYLSGLSLNYDDLPQLYSLTRKILARQLNASR